MEDGLMVKTPTGQDNEAFNSNNPLAPYQKTILTLNMASPPKFKKMSPRKVTVEGLPLGESINLSQYRRRVSGQ